jgi:hypothetical protein
VEGAPRPALICIKGWQTNGGEGCLMDRQAGRPERRGRRVRTLSILQLGCILMSGLVATPALAAVKYKRFPPCSEGAVTAATCECHAGTSGRYHFCHAGNTCDANAGRCHK